MEMLFFFFFRDSTQTDLPKVETLTYQSVLQNELLGKAITDVLVRECVCWGGGGGLSLLLCTYITLCIIIIMYVGIVFYIIMDLIFNRTLRMWIMADH